MVRECHYGLGISGGNISVEGLFVFVFFIFLKRERVIKGLIDGYGNDPDRIAFLLISRVIPATHTQLKVIYTLSFSNSDPRTIKPLP